MKKIILSMVVIVGGGVLWFIVAHSFRVEVPSPSDRLRITTSIYPLWNLTQTIAGERARVTVITPLGTEPHEYEPTPGDIAKIYASHLFIYNGNGVDAWAEKIVDDLLAKGITVLAMNDFFDSRPDDPHFWLDPTIVQEESNFIANVLSSIVDPQHTRTYQANRDRYNALLSSLDADYRNGLADCARREIVTSHDAFRYLAKKYGLTSFSVLGLSPEEEPSPKIISDVARTARERHMTHIFFESLVSPKLSETIANEIGAKTLVLNPIENITDEEMKSGENYISLMRKNLTNLQIALACQKQ